MSSWERPSHHALPYGKRASPYGIRPPGTGSYLGAQRLKVPVPFIPPLSYKTHAKPALCNITYVNLRGDYRYKRAIDWLKRHQLQQSTKLFLTH